MAKLMESLQTDLSTRVYRVTNGFNEALYLIANEPSLGMYRIQEHIQNTVPKVIEQRQALSQVCHQVDGACYDLEYDTQAVLSMSKVGNFSSISKKIMQAVELKTRLDKREPSVHLGVAQNVPKVNTVKVTESLNSDFEIKPKIFD